MAPAFRHLDPKTCTSDMARFAGDDITNPGGYVDCSRKKPRSHQSSDNTLIGFAPLIEHSALQSSTTSDLPQQAPTQKSKQESQRCSSPAGCRLEKMKAWVLGKQNTHCTEIQRQIDPQAPDLPASPSPWPLVIKYINA